MSKFASITFAFSTHSKYIPSIASYYFFGGFGVLGFGPGCAAEAICSAIIVSKSPWVA